MSTKPTKDVAEVPAPYYYASGQRVELLPDNSHQALDLTQTPGAQRQALLQSGRCLSSTVVLLDKPATQRGSKSSTMLGVAKGAQALPVFKSGDSLLVAMPEVRVEDEDGVLALVDAWLRAEPGRATVLDSRAGRITLRAGPALSFDGVALARELVESCKVASASPRLLRVAPGAKR